MAAQESPFVAGDTPRLSRRVASDEPAVSAGRRRFTRLRRPSRRRLTPETDTDASQAATTQFEQRPRGGAVVAPIDVTPVAAAAPSAAVEAETPRRRGRVRAGGRGRGSRRRVSRVRGAAATTEPPAPPTSTEASAPSQTSRRRQPAQPQPAPARATADGRSGGRGSGRAGSKFNLDAFLKEKNRLPTVDVGTSGLPGHTSVVTGPASAPALAPALAPAPTSAPVSAPAPVISRRNRVRKPSVSTFQIAQPRFVKKPRRPALSAPSTSVEATRQAPVEAIRQVPVEPSRQVETQITPLQEPENTFPALDTPVKGTGRRSGSRAGSRTASRTGSRVGSRGGSRIRSRTGSRAKNALGRRGTGREPE